VQYEHIRHLSQVSALPQIDSLLACLTPEALYDLTLNEFLQTIVHILVVLHLDCLSVVGLNTADRVLA
jgi:hypothetical protein